MPKKDSKNQKKSIGIKETLAGADTSLMEKQLKEQIEAPMVRLSYTYAMDVVQAKLKMINADLTEQFDRQVIRSMTYCASMQKSSRSAGITTATGWALWSGRTW